MTQKVPGYSCCRLCSNGTKDSLCESHAFSKFYWEWMKDTGDCYFRDPRRPNLRFQDGIKRKMLCAQCEERFSAVETPFATRIFRPLMVDPSERVCYDSYALRFLVSVLWRNLALDLDDIPDAPWRKDLEAVEAEWRDGLLDRGELRDFGRVHMIVTDFVTAESPQYNYYLTRVADNTAIYTETRLIGYYVKFAKLIVVAEIVPFDSAEWMNTRIDPQSGVYQPGTVQVRDGAFGKFLISRARMIEDYRIRGRSIISPRQKELVRTRAERELPRLRDSEMIRALSRDLGLE